jgi:hypothetical protein
MAHVTGKSGIKEKLSSQIQEVASQPPHEGEMTKRIEQQTAKIPSLGFLGLAVGSMVASAGLAFFADRKDLANFVGLWAPSLLLIGIYNKLVKLENEGFLAQGGVAGQRFAGQQGSTGQSYTGQGYAGSQGYMGGQGVSGQGASAQGVSSEGYTGI